MDRVRQRGGGMDRGGEVWTVCTAARYGWGVAIRNSYISTCVCTYIHAACG